MFLPLPTGEGAAKRRVRGAKPFIAPLLPFYPPSPLENASGYFTFIGAGSPLPSS